MTNQNSDMDQLSAVKLREKAIILAEENERFRDLFITILPEILTPLTIIHSYGSLLLAEKSDHFAPLDENQTKAVKAMTDNATMVRELVDKSRQLGRREETALNIHTSLIHDYQRELQEANQQLEGLNAKYQAMQDILQNFRHEMLEAVNRMMGFSRLFLEKPELMGGPLNREQLEGIEIIRQSAEHNYEIIKHYFFDRLEAIKAIGVEPAPEKVMLAEMGEMTEFAVESELDLETAVSINKFEVRAIINLLAAGWYQRNTGSVLEVTAVSDDTLRFRFPHTIEIRYNTEDIVDEETGRLKFTERQRYFDPVGLATGLVEKYGGAVYAELTGEGTCHLSFTLPVYREES